MDLSLAHPDAIEHRGLEYLKAFFLSFCTTETPYFPDGRPEAEEEDRISSSATKASGDPDEGMQEVSGSKEIAGSESEGRVSWEGVKLLAGRLQAVPYASAFLAQCTTLLLRLIGNKVYFKP